MNNIITELQKIPADSSAQVAENRMLPAVFSSTDMVSFGYFIRDNYYGVGAPKLMSYHPGKYPHGSIPEIFHYWCLENGR